MEKTHKLLVIDDDEETLAALCDFLRKKNYDVFSASNGHDGLNLIEKEEGEFDLIITDIVMPDIGGVWVIATVKKTYPDIPTIAITGWGEQPETLATEAEADVVLRKPFKLVELDQIITDLLLKQNSAM
jgi:DNA-binding response OmpR family regulator